jgi:putative endonuclease
MAEHRQGLDPRAYTFRRRPVVLEWAEEFATHDEAFRCERQIKGWRREKKEALIRGDLRSLPRLARGRGAHPTEKPS